MALKLSFIIEAVDRATAPVRAINRMIESTTGPVMRVNRAWSNLTGQVRGIATHVTLMTGAIAGAFYPLHRMIDEGSKIHDMAANLGITTREFQRLAYALTLDGGSIEDAGVALKFLESNATSAALGNQEMVTWFRRAGMSAEFLRANLNNPKAMLDRLADSMQKLPVAAMRMDLMRTLLGRGGDRLVQTMSRGSKGLEQVGDEGESLGVILEDSVINKMDEAGDGMQKVWRVIKNLTAVIAVAAIPLIEKIGAAIIEWSKANRALTQQRMTEFFDRISASLPKVITAVIAISGALVALVGIIDKVAGAIGGWDNVIIAIVAVKAAMLVGALAQVGLALAALTPAIVAIGTALLTTPLGWFLAAVAAIAGAAYLVYRNWEPIAKFFTDLWANITRVTDKLGVLGMVMRFTPAGLAMQAVSAAVGPSAGVQAANVGGTIKIEIDAEGRARVAQLQSENRNVDFEVYSGLIMSLP